VAMNRSAQTAERNATTTCILLGCITPPKIQCAIVYMLGFLHTYYYCNINFRHPNRILLYSRAIRTGRDLDRNFGPHTFRPKISSLFSYTQRKP